MLMLGGCKDGVKPVGAAQAGPVVVTVERVAVRPVQRTIEVTGTLFGEEEATISAKLSGRIAAIMADVGDEVGAGDLLAQIEKRDYELALEQRRTAVLASLARIGLTQLPGEDFDLSAVPTVVQARAEAANAEARYKRAKQLFETEPPVISEQDFADARTVWEVAASGAEVQLLTARSVLAEARARAAEASVAEQRLADTSIRAPGTAGERTPRYQVAQRMVSLGEYVGEGQPTYLLVASDTVKFRAEVPERYVGEVQVGQTAQVWVEAYTEQVAGTVARASPRIDPMSRTYEIEVHVANADRRLKPGAFARGSIATRVEEGVMLIPEAALVTFAGVQKVYSVREGKAVEHRVQTGVRADGFIEIVGGLKIDAVVTSGAAGLSPGAPVQVAQR
jgi:RND family efflux transporter MFP subunit